MSSVLSCVAGEFRLRPASCDSRSQKMASLTDPVEMMAFTSALLLLLLIANRALEVLVSSSSEEDEVDHLGSYITDSTQPLFDTEKVTAAALHNFKLFNVFALFDDDLGFWVKPRSTTWVSKFLLEQYDDSRWLEMFRMTKSAVYALADLLRPHVQKQDTKYRMAVPVLVRVACTLFKLIHGASLLICSEMFVVGRSTISLILRDVVCAINDTLRHELMWPTGQRIGEVQDDFFNLCGLPGVVGAIDGTHISISKPRFGLADYFYFKSGGYTLNCQAVVDSNKRFLDLYIGMPGSTNDACILRRSSLYHLAMHNNLFDARDSVDGFAPYLIGDFGYPLLPWLMVPHRGLQQLTATERLFNRKLRRGRCVVENAFGILKQTFRELLGKSKLSVTFLPNVISACTILHNILLGQSHDEVERLLGILRNEGLAGGNEGLAGEVLDDKVDGMDIAGEPVREDISVEALRGADKRSELGVYLAMQRNIVL
jgi:hypothetical protein